MESWRANLELAIKAFKTEKKVRSATNLGEQVILTLIRGRTPHNDDILLVLGIFAVNERKDLIVDDAGIGIVHSAVTADEQLRGSLPRSLVREQLTELRVGIDDVGNTLGGIETCDLDDVVASGEGKGVHLVLGAEATELAHVELRIPWVKLFVQTIEPVNTC